MDTEKHRPSLRFKIAALCMVLGSFLLLTEYTLSLLYDPFREFYTGFNKGMAASAHNFFLNDPDLIRKLDTDLEIPHPNTLNLMHTNSKGFRVPDFEWEKKPGTKRAIFLGDSTLFGMTLPDDETVPWKVQEALGPACEVINMAVPSYSSCQGLVLAQKYFSVMKPDVVVVGFGFTDGALVEFSDREVQAALAKAPWFWMHPIGFLRSCYTYQLIRSIFRPKEVETVLYVEAFMNREDARITPRVPPEEFKSNIEGILEIVKKLGGDAVLLDSNLVNFYARDALEAIAKQREIPFLSVRSIFEEAVSTEPFELHEGRAGPPFVAVQVKGYPKEGEEEYQQPFLIKSPLGQKRFPFIKPYLYFRDTGTRGDLEADDGVFTTMIYEIDDPPFEYSVTTGLPKSDRDFQFFINNTIFYRLPPSDTFAEGGIYYAPVIDVTKPFYEEFTYPFEKPLVNRKGVRLIADALLPLLRKSLKQ